MKTKGTKQKIQEANSIKQVNSLEKKALSFELASPKTLRKIAKAIAIKRKELKITKNFIKQLRLDMEQM